MHRNLRRIVVLLTVAIFAPAAALLGADGPSPPSDDLQQLNSALVDGASTSVQREEAARRLLQRSSLAATVMLQGSLQNGSVPVQMAIARAIAGDPNPDPSFIPLLRPLLDISAALTREAARALTNYPNNPEVLAILKTAANKSKLPEASRIQVIRALGLLVDKSAASFLIEIINSPRSMPMKRAAADALAEMTGVRDVPHDATYWQTWWSKNAGKPDNQWSADLLNSRVREFSQARQQYNEMADNLHDLLAQQYSMIGEPKAKKTDALLLYLQSPVPQARVDGIKLVYDDFNNGRPIADEVREHIRSMIGDSDRNVRLQVAQTLRAINDLGASTALITQLNQEPDRQVRLLIVQALDESGDVRAFPSLVKMLDDPSVDGAAAAATAIADMGEKLRQDKSRADDVKQAIIALQKTLDGRTGAGQDMADGLRAACVTALAALGGPESAGTFKQLLMRPNESSDVRKSALRGLGNLGNPQTTDLIANSLTDAKPEVRLEAALGLRKLATFAQAEQLKRMLNKDEEPDPRVRDAVWNDLKTVLQNGTPGELNGWADRFRDDSEKQLEVLQALHGALAKQNDQRQLAICDQNIGDLLINQLSRPQDAIDYFQSALNYWQTNSANDPATLAALVGDMLDALLAAGKYQAAVDFAAKEIAVSPSYQDIIGPKIKTEADRLRTPAVNEKDKSLNLIDAALKMPKEKALPAKYQNDLLDIQRQINQTPAGP